MLNPIKNSTRSWTKSLKSSAAALMLALSVSACATVQATLPNPDSLYPVEMTTCADEPAVPPRPQPGEARSETVKAGYVAELRAFGVDCKDTVDAWHARRERYVLQWEQETHSTGERVWRHLTGRTGDTTR